MSAHTPGPWHVEPVPAALSTLQKDFLIVYSDGELRSHIARLFDNCLCTEHGTTETNARLIAAAPDLLDTLMQAASRLELLHVMAESGKHDNIPPQDDMLKRIRAAIAKAEGKP